MDRMIYRKRRQILLKIMYLTPSKNIDIKLFKLDFVKGENMKLENILQHKNHIINFNNLSKILSHTKKKGPTYKKRCLLYRFRTI